MSERDDAELSPLKRALVEIRELKAKVAAAERRETEPIAIVGMGVRFPGGANDPSSYWQLLVDGADAIEEVPADRWPIERYYDPDPDVPGRMATRWGGFLPDIDRFDAAFFGISPREAETMDPQQRILLEVTWEALEHAGIPADSLAGTRTGVFVGVTNTDYFRLLLADPEQIDTFTSTGNLASVAAGRISYVLGLEGPSIAVDTACSSSLVAVHLAAQSLRSGESDVALAGGVSLVLAPELTINFSRAHMMAADGRCKTFDATADGYVRSDGCGVLVLKRLSDAAAAGDRVLAVVRGSAVNQDGRSGGLTAPNGPAQERVIAQALANAGVAPSEVGYVEAHGTGTPLGDPIEVQALSAVLGKDRERTNPLLLGSVKTNIGHLEGAAGVAGLMKAVLMLQHGTIPPHLHLTELNPHIAETTAAAVPIEIPTTARPWQRPAHGRVAGVSSFGISGTNAHVIVGEAPATDDAQDADAADDARPTVLLLSARSDEALRDLASAVARTIVDDDDVQDLAASAAVHRAHLSHRLALVAADAGDAVTHLTAFATDLPSDVVSGRAGTEPSDVVFLFSGHGSHLAGMGTQLHRDQPVFRAAIDRCAQLVAPDLERPLTDLLFGDPLALARMGNAQPALFALQYALAELWGSWGVRPAAVAGHSAGEYVAAVVAGVLTLEDALRLVTARGRLMETLPDDGEMAAIFLPEPEVAAAVAAWPDDVGIAAVNGPATTVISGRRDAVAAVIDSLDLAPGDHRRLAVSVAAHSPLVEPILDDFESVARTTQLGRPRVPLISSLTGVTGAPEDVGYWRRHLREPVRFADVFATLRDAGYTTFVEIGPGSTLLKLGQRSIPDRRAVWVPSIEPGEDEELQMLDGAAALHVSGARVDWPALLPGDGHRRRRDLPAYPWQRRRFWAPASARPATTSTPVWPTLVVAAEAQAEQAPIDLSIADHERGWALLDELATVAIVIALRARNAFAAAGERWSAAQLVASGRIDARYEGLVDRWLGHLAHDGLLRAEGDGSFVAAQPLPQRSLDDAVAAARSCFADAPEVVDYVVRCAESLDAVVAGAESALTTLFPDGSYATVDFLYHHWAVTRYFNGIVRAAVTAIARAHPTSVLRILEVGAGTGGTTAAVLPALDAERTDYTFTDVSDFFLARAAERFAGHRFVAYRRLDLEHDLADDGFEPGRFDVVVAANVLHATTDLDATLKRVRELLAPGGMLVAYEATEHFRWFDVTTGLIDGWQRFADRWRDGNPLLPAATWAEALAANGFADVLTLPHDERRPAVLGQRILIARAPGDALARESDRPDGAARAGVDRTTVVASVPVPDHAEIVAALAEALPAERIEVFVDVVRRAIAHVLRIDDPASVPRDQPLLDLGFDSLMAVELRDVLRRSLALSRRPPATLVFDHPTVTALATHMEHLAAGGSSASNDTTPTGAATVATASARHDALGEKGVAELSDDEVTELLLAKLADVEESR